MNVAPVRRGPAIVVACVAGDELAQHLAPIYLWLEHLLDQPGQTGSHRTALLGDLLGLGDGHLPLHLTLAGLGRGAVAGGLHPAAAAGVLLSLPLLVLLGVTLLVSDR